VSGNILVGIRRLAQLFDFFQFFLAQIEEILLEFRLKHAFFLRSKSFPSPTASIAAEQAVICRIARRRVGRV
jgi:hypothetical protein